jgi:hypothetical protein
VTRPPEIEKSGQDALKGLKVCGMAVEKIAGVTSEEGL